MQRFRGHGFALLSGFICFLWAFLGWLTVIPNQDILADGIQAQSLISDPRIVLSFPGQKHGGPIEYPFTILAEWLAPGNYFANALIRPFFAFITGFLIAKLFQTLFPMAPRWSFIAAIALGPTIIHGMLGPEGNPVGVWWLQPNWDVAWPLITGGALLAAVNLRKIEDGIPMKLKGLLVFLLAGIFIGLGFWAHPATILLIVPLVSLVLMRFRFLLLPVLITFLGSIIGIIPAGISYIVNADISTWNPSHGAFIAIDYYISMGGSVLGLDGVPDYIIALLPYGMGFAPSQIIFDGYVQTALVAATLIAFTVTALVATVNAVKHRRKLSYAGAISISWIITAITLMVFITFIDPVWIYSSSYSILFWLTVGALPTFFTVKWLGNIITFLVLFIEGTSTITHNANFYSDIPQRIDSKVETMNSNKELAGALLDSGAEYIFGSYYDAVPIGYASGGDLRTITSRYNRFPLSELELQRDSIIVAVNLQPTEDWGIESLDLLESNCESTLVDPSSSISPFGIYKCSPLVLDIRQ